ncbi:MAG: TonB-dependent receptor [Gammaproteobacteria bacterium]|nr:TonB-dependent receptor [Gammaproteobacteria bacterium]
MKRLDAPKSTSLPGIVACILLSVSAISTAQEAHDKKPVIAPPWLAATDDDVLDEVVVTGRFISASQKVINERISDSSVTDLLDANTIERLGDSTVGEALRRIPGLTLVADKYIYIRGLGERYSSTSLNGAQIPSPDLTRNVIPLDVFPTAVVRSLRVQKSWSADLPANFGGGAVNIRTKGIPDEFTLKLELGGGYNSLGSGSGLTYAGGGKDWLGTDDGSRALSPVIQSTINQMQGDISVQNILTTLQRSDPAATLAEAQTLNRNLALQLNRDIGVRSKNMPLDLQLRANVGNNYDVGQDWELGFSLGGAYQTRWRKTTAKATNFNFPDQRTNTEEETTFSVNMAGTLNLGVKFLEDHEISTTTLWLRNTDDETATRDFFNENREIEDGLGFRSYRFQFEERNLLTNQIRGKHYLGEATRERFPFLAGFLAKVPTDTSLAWFFSDSNATTDIPNQVKIASQTITDPVTTAVVDEQVTLSNTAADFRFTELDDAVQNYGWSLSLPIMTDRHYVVIGGGYNHTRKARIYRQTQFSLGAIAVTDSGVLQGPLEQVFSDESISNAANNFLFDRQGTNNESYIAATMTDAVFGTIDWTYDDTWRVATGARWEHYRQAAVAWNPYGYSLEDPQVTADPDVLEAGTFSSDEIYPTASLTYMSDWMAETFQLRLGWSETTIRPDLREITDASYIDPITGDLTRGSQGVLPADVRNFDLRGEWFFGDGDNLTVTLFRKAIDKPIEYFESAASDTTVAREILNATSATVQGVELEGLKRLGFLGGIFDTLFVQGNVTFQSSELICDIGAANSCAADSPTNPIRSLSGASDYVANVMLGFDSPEARHSVSVSYNVFGERLYVAGRNGAPDGFEQPFRSLDLTYFWYPTEAVTVKLKAQNLLGETVAIERNGIVTFQEDPGQMIGLAFSWAM